MTDSATGGYLAPSSSSAIYDDGLIDALHDVVVGITGLSGALVRPRWQEVPPAQPPASTDWCALGVLDLDPAFYGALVHRPEEEGSTTLYRNQTIEAMVSFYGPNRFGLAARLVDGLLIPQNWEPTAGLGLAHLETSRIVGAAELVNTNWVRRADVRWLIARRTSRTYPIRNVLSPDGAMTATIVTDAHQES